MRENLLGDILDKTPPLLKNVGQATYIYTRMYIQARRHDYVKGGASRGKKMDLEGSQITSGVYFNFKASTL